MRFVRLQIAIPIAVLVALATNIICALAISPGLRGINELFPTLLSPNATMLGLYMSVMFILEVGFCLVLLLARKDVTKETLIHGVGVRFAVANWLQAAWAICFTLQFFKGAEVILIINTINLITIKLTLLKYPVSLKRPLDAFFIHAPIVMLLSILFQLGWLHNGFIALDWVMENRHDRDRYTWEAVGFVLGTNVVAAIYEGIRRNYFMALACEYILFTLVFSSPRTNPTLPTTALPKPTALLITLIVCLVLHPLAILAGVAWKRTQEREGRIRLEEEAEQAHEEELEAEIRARLERERRQGAQA